MTAEELRLELAIFLYAQEKLSIGQARHLAGLDHISFQKAMAKRNVYLHLDWEDVEEDLQNLEKLPPRRSRGNHIGKGVEGRYSVNR
ncbi:MAG: UPF0175 family protein [Bacteroidota bacterium]